MKITRNITIEPSQIVLDHYSEYGTKSIAIFAHGIKGFKDWGIWDLMAQRITQNGVDFVKFNFSHNGTTPEFPDEFRNLEKFEKNTHSIELNDLIQVINWVEALPKKYQTIVLIGHSRGGPIVLAGGLIHKAVKGIITWAAVDNLDYFWRNKNIVDHWKDSGYHRIINGRTGQEMKVGFELYKDYYKNEDRLNTNRFLNRLKKPVLIMHGDDDEAVDLQSARHLKAKAPNARLVICPNANHVFNGKHPWNEQHLPDQAEFVVERSLEFIEEVSEAAQ